MNETTDNKQITRNIEKIYKHGNIQKAIELCQYEIVKNPTNADLHIKLGDLYLEWHLDIYQARQYIDEAITEYQRALETYISSARLYYKIGRAFFYKNELEKAISYFKQAIEKNPKFARAYYMIAECYTRQYDFVGALEYVKKAIEANKIESSRAHFLHYSLLKLFTPSGIKKFLICSKELLLSILTLPFDNDAMKALGKLVSYLKFIPILMKGMISVQSHGVNKAIEIYHDAIEKTPGFTLLYCILGKIYQSVHRYDDAICEYKMAIWLDSLNITAYQSLCSTYVEQGDYDNAIDIYKKLIKIQPYVSDHYDKLASIYYLKENVKDAISCFQNAITLNTNTVATSILAQTLGYLFQTSHKDLDAAISCYQTAYVLTPDDIDIYINLGNAFYDKEEYDSALIVYKKALDSQPYNARIHCNIGYLHWGTGHIEEAIKEYELAIRYDEAYDVAYNNLGVIYLDDLGTMQKAIELFEKAVRCNPNYVLAYYNLARSTAIKGDKVEAAKLYQIALDLNKVSNEIDEADIKEKIQNLFT